MGTLVRCWRFVPPYSLLYPLHSTTKSGLTNIKSLSRRKPAKDFCRSFCSISQARCCSSPSVSASSSVHDDNNGVTPTPKFQIFNTMSKQKEEFRPNVPGKVGMYVCGVTTYDLSHIGHARVYVTFDVLYRYLRHLGYDVCYVRNFTDVDDKIIARSNDLAEDPLSLSNRYCNEFLIDMASLQCLPPSVEPRVSEHINQIIDMIKQILDNGCAYVIDGDVYFSINKFPDYGRLSGRKLEDNRAGERVAVDSRKQNPADFALWKGKKQALRIESLQALGKEVSGVLSILGLMPSSYSEVLGQLKSKALLRAGVTEEEVLRKIEDRNSARKNKDYEKSDKIREELGVKGIALMHNPDGTAWRPSIPLEMQELLISST